MLKTVVEDCFSYASGSVMNGLSEVVPIRWAEKLVRVRD